MHLSRRGFLKALGIGAGAAVAVGVGLPQEQTPGETAVVDTVSVPSAWTGEAIAPSVMTTTSGTWTYTDNFAYGYVYHSTDNGTVWTRIPVHVPVDADLPDGALVSLWSMD